MSDAKTFRYVDRFSTFTLWWKAILLTPFWAILAVPFVGGIFGLLGEVSIQIGFPLLLGIFGARFIDDVLRTKIKIENGVLKFGFQRYNLAELASVGLEYKDNHVLPKAIVLNFSSGKKLALKISRLRAEDAESLLKHIETRYQNAKVDPVLRTLSKCKRLVRNTALETSDKVEIPYHSRRIFQQLKETFMTTADKWVRVGPILCFIVCSPLWLSWFSNLYTSFNMNPYDTAQKLVMKKSLEAFISQMGSQVGAQINNAGTQFSNLVETPLMAVLMGLCLMGLVYYLMRFLFRPNVIMMEPNVMALQLRLWSLGIQVGTVPYDSLVNAYLVKPRKTADPDKWKIVFNRKNKKPFSLLLGAITPDNRGRFLKAIERLAPDCAIEAELAETMMPKQERSYTELWLQSLTAPPERKSLEPLSPGQTLQESRYEVLRRLGVGGQGMAYLCKDTSDLQTSHQVDIVLKETILPVFVESTVRQQALERFQQEADLLQKLDCDGVVKLMDYFIEDHRGYLVLEHINGRTLRQIVEEDGPISEDRARELGLQMCEILEYLHGKGVIHRDFTPDNLILRHDGKLKLIDFNVAQQAQDGTTGTIVGKHAFLPPEQFRGKPNFQSDIYAMGATLHFLITGKDPEPISQSRPAEHNPQVTEAFSQVVAHCTELQCNKRIATAATVKQRILETYATEDDGVSISIKQTEQDTIAAS